MSTSIFIDRTAKAAAGPRSTLRLPPRTLLALATGLGQVGLHRLLGRGCRVVFDIDNTLMDTRYRTLAATRAFARQHPALAGPLGRLGVDQMQENGQLTARAAGLAPAAVQAFAAFWEGFFWDPSNFVHDRPVREVQQAARLARLAGAEVFYLTGRNRSLKAATMAQLRRHGLPAVDLAHVLCKPDRLAGKEGTLAFKSHALAALSGGHLPAARRRPVLWLASDSPVDLRAARQATDHLRRRPAPARGIRGIMIDFWRLRR